MATIYIGMGSNEEDREAYLRRTLDEIARDERLSLIRMSSLYRTQPWGFTDQPWFLNAVAELESNLEPHELLNVLKTIELIAGRKPTFRWGPREIDLDILMYDDLILNEPGLTIPHPGMKERAFVLKPLVEIAPDLRDPKTNRPWQEFWDELPDADKTGVQLFKPSLER